MLTHDTMCRGGISLHVRLVRARVFVSTCMYVCVYVCVYPHVRKHTKAYEFNYVFMYVCASICMYVRMCVCVYVYTYIHYTHIYALCTCICIHLYIHMHKQIHICRYILEDAGVRMPFASGTPETHSFVTASRPIQPTHPRDLGVLMCVTWHLHVCDIEH